MDDIAQLSKNFYELKGAITTFTATIEKTQTQHREDIGKLFTGLAEVNTSIAGLPCSDHSRRLDDAESWQCTHNGVNKDKDVKRFEMGLSLKNGIILAAAGASCSALGALVVWLITNIPK